jgi:hypothetical protein
MPLSSLVPLLTGGGGAVAALLLGYALLLSGHLTTGRAHREVMRGLDMLVRDKDHQIDTLTMALARERERGDAAILAAQVTREVVAGIRKAVE